MVIILSPKGQRHKGGGAMDDFCRNISIPEAKEVVGDFEPIIPFLYGAFELAHSIVPEIIRPHIVSCSEFKSATKWIYAPFMRFLVQSFLHDDGIQTHLWQETDENNLKWEPRILANNGLAGSFKGYEYRILKAMSSDDLSKKLPPPGYSRVKKRYYRQDHLKAFQPYLLPPDGMHSQIAKPNMIFLWETIDNCVNLYLSCPSWGDEVTAAAYYIVPIEHPVTTYKPSSATDEVPKEIEITKKVGTEQRQ
jgi:hypothetical protein